MSAGERIGLVLTCEGMGDCLFALAVIRKMHRQAAGRFRFDVFTHHPGLFKACPYVEQVFALADRAQLDGYPARKMKMFELDKLPHGMMDTFNFISIPLGLGELGFRDKQLEYFPVEEDAAEAFDVVLNTSVTWPSRTWALENWQRLADTLAARAFSVAVVGRDVSSAHDGMVKRSPPLAGCRNLVNQLSLDQTFFTIRKARLFVSCQNGLSVLAGATDTEIVVLDMSIDWSKRAIYRHGDPFHRVTYVRGGCDIYCGQPNRCPLPQNAGRFHCIPDYDAVATAVLGRLLQ
jgi:ADP-heptose:LPS heptosyltransferase